MKALVSKMTTTTCAASICNHNLRIVYNGWNDGDASVLWKEVQLPLQVSLYVISDE